jgi:hypothetical protein
MNRTHTAAKTITVAIALLAVVISYTHIVHLFNMLGLHGWQAYVAPIFIDGFGLLGLLASGQSFAPETRALGKRFRIAATLVSLLANVAAGDSAGAMIFGGMVVFGYLAAEYLAERMTSVEAHTAAAASAKRSASAKQAAATRKANAAKKAPAKRKPTTRPAVRLVTAAA